MGKLFYIKERLNPQLPNPYYQALGQLTKKEAKKYEEALYGYNNIIGYDTEDKYNAALEELKKNNFRIY